jgi:hypothetical protein
MTDNTHEFGIAVLLPTRGRSDALERSVKSLFNLADNPDNIQLMLGFDEDDAEGISAFEDLLQPWLDEHGVNYTAMSFEPLGYTRLNEYVNTLAHASDSDWLFFWNDDAFVETKGWDTVIQSHTGEFKLLAVHTHNDHPYSIFPIAPRAWLDHMGHLSPHQISDAWLSQQAYMLDIWERIPVNVVHDRHDLTGNNDDATFQNRVMFEGNPSSPHDFHHPEWSAIRVAGCDKLAEYMQENGISTEWWEAVKSNKQDPWAKLKVNDVNKQMVQFNHIPGTTIRI